MDHKTSDTTPARMTALGDILKERRHQVECGRTADKLEPGELTRAAMAAIAVADDAGPTGALTCTAFWPFDYREMPHASMGRRWLLVQAAAALLGELESLPRPDDGQPSAAVLLLTGQRGKGAR